MIKHMLSVICIIGLLSIPAFSATPEKKEEPVKPVSPELLLIAQKKAEFDGYLKKTKDVIENIANPDFYKNVVFKSKDEKGKEKVKKFESLSPLEKHLFYLWVSDNFNQDLFRKFMGWYSEWYKLHIVEQFNSDDNKKKSPTWKSENVAEYLNALQEIRKTHAKRFENLVAEGLKEFKDKVSEHQLKEMLEFEKRIKTMHDMHSLVPRIKEQKEEK